MYREYINEQNNDVLFETKPKPKSKYLFFKTLKVNISNIAQGFLLTFFFNLA